MAATNAAPPAVSKRAAAETDIPRAAPKSPAVDTAFTNKANAVAGAAVNSGATAAAVASSNTNTNTNTGSAKPALRSGDPDVDLMAALMVHMNSTRAGAEALAAPTKPNGAANSSGTQVAALGDLSNATIAGLVARCEKLAVSEANQCRRRICRGSWGKADACPIAKTIPKTSAKTKAKTSLKDKKRKQDAKRNTKSAALLAPAGFATEATASSAASSSQLAA